MKSENNNFQCFVLQPAVKEAMRHPSPWSSPARLLLRPTLATSTSSLQSFAPCECLCFISVYFVLQAVTRTLRCRPSWGFPLHMKLDGIKHIWYDLGNYFFSVWKCSVFFIQINGNCFCTLHHFSLGRFHRNALLSDCRENLWSTSPAHLLCHLYCTAIFHKCMELFLGSLLCSFKYLLPFFSESVVHGAAAAASPCSLFGMQNLKPHPRPSQLGSAINKVPRGFLWVWQFEKYYSTPCFWNPSAIALFHVLAFSKSSSLCSSSCWCHSLIWENWNFYNNQSQS